MSELEELTCCQMCGVSMSQNVLCTIDGFNLCRTDIKLTVCLLYVSLHASSISLKPTCPLRHTVCGQS